MVEWTLRTYKTLDGKYGGHMKIFRFIVSGGTAAATNLGTLFLLTHFFHVWYLLSSVVAFLVSFGVSFTLQKFWTFRDHSRDRIHVQAVVYFAVLIIGLAANTLFMYIFVDYAGLHYLVAAIISGALIAFFNYFAYQKFIFVNATQASSAPAYVPDHPAE